MLNISYVACLIQNSALREIFGPILPIIPIDDVDEAIKFVNSRYALDAILI
jgi:acyl-CoA reductase-like NAD-dependent aldehyde dehydrogenase